MNNEKLDKLKVLFFTAVKKELPTFKVGEMTTGEMLASEKAIEKVYIEGLKNAQKIDDDSDGAKEVSDALELLIKQSDKTREVLDKYRLKGNSLVLITRNSIKGGTDTVGCGDILDMAKSICVMLREDKTLSSMVNSIQVEAMREENHIGI